MQVGPGIESGRYGPFKDDRWLAKFEAGVERQLSEHVFAQCEAWHVSYLTQEPEIVLNAATCGLEVR